MLSWHVTSYQYIRSIMIVNLILFCSALKKAFAADEIIQKMAQDDFIMLNLVVRYISSLCHTNSCKNVYIDK